MAASVTKIAYQTMQQGKSLLGIAHKQVSTQLMDLVAPKANAETIPIRAETLEALRTSMDYLLERDWLEAEQGLYPTSQLFDAPWLDWMLRYPLVWLDLPNIWNRRLRRDVRDLPNNVDISNFPDYYLQNFHHQTDGYLSDRSAELYDLQVELLFNGTADAMRRRILKPLKERLSRANLASGALRILDVASGTGRTLRQLRGAFSSAQLVGLDLSNAYLRQANRWLSQLPGELPQLVQGNAEALPFQNESMQALSCVFLLHELPAEAREFLQESVAHNACFDRRWFGCGQLPCLDMPWVCSMEDLAWPKALGLKARPSLRDLALAFSIPVWAAHRALTDCIYIAQVFERCDDLEALLLEALEPRQLYQAQVSYAQRQLAKDAGFRWNEPIKGAWTRRLSQRQLQTLELPFEAKPLAG